VCYLREHGDTHINDIAAALDIELSALLSAMTILELDGYVETLFGAIYRAV
jgi:DNA-binding MarR family transcriptional regulator